jgi:hypothetical protein
MCFVKLNFFLKEPEALASVFIASPPILEECLVNPSVATASNQLTEVPTAITLKTLFVVFCRFLLYHKSIIIYFYPYLLQEETQYHFLPASIEKFQ